MTASAQSNSRPLSAAALEARIEDLIGAVLSSRRTAAGISQRLAGETRALQDFALHWVAVTSKTNPELAYQFAALAADAVATLGLPDAERWLLAAMDVYDRDGLYRASATLKDLDAKPHTIEVIQPNFQPYKRELSEADLRIPEITVLRDPQLRP